MQRQPLAHDQRERIAAGLPFVESLARRVASSMPHSIELGDLVQDGMLGLIDAACRFDEARGIKFETFAERRVRGAMIDALRRDAWPRGVRRQRRELEAAREQLRRELGAEPSLADLAARVGSDESAAWPHHRPHQHDRIDVAAVDGENVDGASLPPALVPSEPQSPDKAYEEREVRDRIRAAIRRCRRASARSSAVLLRRSDDEADWRGDRRQRIARLAAARARGPAPAQGARRRVLGGRGRGGARSRAILSFQHTMRRMKMAKARRRRPAARRRARLQGARQAGSQAPGTDAAAERIAAAR